MGRKTTRRSGAKTNCVAERGDSNPGTLAGTSDFESDAIDQLCHLQGNQCITTLCWTSSKRPKNVVSIVPAFVGQHTAYNFRAVIESHIFGNLKQGPDGASFWITTAI